MMESILDFVIFLYFTNQLFLIFNMYGMPAKKITLQKKLGSAFNKSVVNSDMHSI